MSSIKWRFPASNHGERKGISSGDTETFQKNRFQAFAREILQNSIDARASDEDPVIIEMKEFSIGINEIPDVLGLKNAIKRCVSFWNHKKDYIDVYENMLKILNQPKIKCLRVSDYNTTGLIGANSTNQAGNNFLALTKGTGVSEKSGAMAGGSKGVGKNAAFILSEIRTVIYSTNANRDINGTEGSFKGSIGVAELVSGYVDDDETSENRDYTQGTGYLSSDEMNNACDDIISLDKFQKDRNTEAGTDIYIIAFSEEDDWEKEVIISILDSFMSAIVRGELEVKINDNFISKDTIESFVYDVNIVQKDRQKANIVSQYRLLKGGNNIYMYDIDTEYGSCDLHILKYDSKEKEYATHKCAMIRYPLMKIKDEPLGSSFDVSALCIINKGTLGEELRAIENPQHIDWEPKRIKSREKRKEIENILRSIIAQIKAKVIECLQIDDASTLDPNGAGDFLPDVDVGDNKVASNGNQIPAEKVSVSKIKDNVLLEKNAHIHDDDGSGLEPDIGEIDDNSDGLVQHPIGENETEGQGRHPGMEQSGEKEGDNVIFKKAKLSGVRYKVISTDRKSGKLKIIFISPIDNDECYLQISMLDDVNGASTVNITSMKYNGKEIKGSNPLSYGPFSIKTNQKVVLDVTTEVKGYFGSEVKVYASKK